MLIDQNVEFNNLPPVKGRYEFNVPLSQSIWFRTGGPALVVYKPASTEDLCHFLRHKPLNLDIKCIGAGSNILVRDGGINGCVIRLGRPFATIERQENLLILGGGCLDRTVALSACQLGLSGLEFLIGIPGTIGGAIAMNAGAYGHEVKDRLQWIEWVTNRGIIEKLPASLLNMTYRNGGLPEDVIITKAAFLCEPERSSEIQLILNHFLSEREKSQPIRGQTGGSTFKNPSSQLKAWQLIDQASCRGLRIGDAQVSEKHCNFLLNLGFATAFDLEDLGTIVQKRVQQQTAVTLEWEIIRIGKK